MTVEPATTPSTEPAPRAKTAIPKNPGRRDLGMKATLLFPDREIVEKFYVPLIYTACRTCYSELEPDEIFRTRHRRRRRPGEAAEAHPGRHRVRPRLDDRARRVHVRDQRRVADAVAPARPASGRRRVRPAEPALRQVQGRLDDAADVDRGGRPGVRERYEDQIEGSLELYGDLVGAGIPGEDARFVFPNATRTNLVMTTNLRALIHMSGLRLCTMAQWEIRRLFQLIRHEIFQVSPFLGLVPRARMRAARLLRRDGQPRRALPDPAAQGQRARRPGPRSRRRRRPPAGSCRSADGAVADVAGCARRVGRDGDRGLRRRAG